MEKVIVEGKNVLLTMRTFRDGMTAMSVNVERELGRLNVLAESEEDDAVDEALPQRIEAFGKVIEAIAESVPLLDEAIAALTSVTPT